MPAPSNIPLGHSPAVESPIKTAAALGALVRSQRTRLALRQLDVASLGNTGNRFIVELENGKPTVQLQKVLDLLGENLLPEGALRVYLSGLRKASTLFAMLLEVAGDTAGGFVLLSAAWPKCASLR